LGCDIFSAGLLYDLNTPESAEPQPKVMIGKFLFGALKMTWLPNGKSNFSDKKHFLILKKIQLGLY